MGSEKECPLQMEEKCYQPEEPKGEKSSLSQANPGIKNRKLIPKHTTFKEGNP